VKQLNRGCTADGLCLHQLEILEQGVGCMRRVCGRAEQGVRGRQGRHSAGRPAAAGAYFVSKGDSKW
jgi:hypothetical protein